MPGEETLRTIRIYVADIEGLQPLIEKELRGEGRTVSEERIERAQRFVRAEDARRCIGAELLLRRAVERETGRRPGGLRTAREENGKPYLPDFPGLHFNLSHSGGMLLCAVDSRPVGADVELIREIEPDVAESCFTPQERTRLEGKETEEWRKEFYRLWTLKESYLKALGTGLRRNPLSVEITPTDPQEETWQTEGPHTLQTVPAPAGYAAAVCGEEQWKWEMVGWFDSSIRKTPAPVGGRYL